MRRGWIDEQVAASRALYRRKCERMLAALERTMPAGVTWTRPAGGFFTWLTLPGADVGRAARRAPRRPASASSPARCSIPDGSGRENVRLSFSMVDESEIDAGVDLLASLL